MKQYSETMAKLRHWRRDIDQSNEDDDETLQGKKMINFLSKYPFFPIYSFKSKLYNVYFYRSVSTIPKFRIQTLATIKIQKSCF